MQLTELLFQKVKDLGAQGQLSLKPGYTALVSKSPSLRAALVAPLCPAPDDQRRLADGKGPTRVGVGLTGPDGTPYRILRELGGSRVLQRFDAQTRKFGVVSEDPLEIDSFLRVECGMPSPDAYAGFFVLEVDELPSLRARGVAAVGEAYVDQEKVKALRAELEQTRRFEGMQDRLFKVQQRIHELTEARERLDAERAAVAAIEAELARAPWNPDEMRELAARAARSKDELKKRDEALQDIARKRERALRDVPPPPEPFLRNPWFYGGLLLAVSLDVLAFIVQRPWIALLGLVPWTAALVAVLRFIQDDEADKDVASLVVELKEREAAVKKAYEESQAPLRAAVKAAGVEHPEELLEIFRAREAREKDRALARTRLEELEKDPLAARVPVELPVLETERKKLEEEVHAMGFSRAVGEIEADLKHAMGIAEARGKAGTHPEVELPRMLVGRAAELLATPPEELWQQIAQRLAAYLTALTDRRVAGAKADANGGLLLQAADGRTGAYATLPPPLKDAVYAALRLTLLERVAGYKRVPLVVDDAFGSLDPQKRALVGKMLKGIGTQTQVLHRLTEAPPAGVADAVLTA